jgi:ABC-type amino acid transport substrate-binding protein
MCMSRIARVLLLAAVVFSWGYASAAGGVGEEGVPAALRVGITPDHPPMIFRLGGNITGVEADMAHLLGGELKRPVESVELAWDDEIPALLEGRIDIIMSGMTVTDARKVRVNFSEPYLEGGLAAAIRRGEASKFSSFADMLPTYPAVGVIGGTTAESFMRSHYPKLRLVTFRKTGDIAFDLKNRRIDVFVNDAPAVAWFVSENEGEVAALRELLNAEDYAWPVRRDDPALLAQVNSALAKWRGDGTLKRILHRWLPHWDSIRQQNRP